MIFTALFRKKCLTNGNPCDIIAKDKEEERVSHPAPTVAAVNMIIRPARIYFIEVINGVNRFFFCI